MLADQERIDVDRLDHVAQITGKPSEIDQRVAQRVDVARLAAAEPVEQCPGAGRAHHLTGLLAVERRRRKADVLEQFDHDAAHAEHDDRTHFNIALHAKHDLGSSGDLLGDQHTVQRRRQRACAGRNGGGGLPHGVGIRQVEEHEAGVAFVRQRSGDGLEHDREADRLRRRHRFVGRCDQPLRWQRNSEFGEQRLRVRPR